MTNERLKINSERLWQSLMDLAKVGATERGGNCRLALTALDGAGRDLVVGWMKQEGLSVTVDEIGNIFGRREGKDPTAAAVVTGSHIDTQATGGKFDGCYGVLAGLEIMRTLNDANINTYAPLELAIWTNEEGARFAPVMMGSGVYAGKFTLEHALGAVDAQGISVASELKAIGYAGSEPVGGRNWRAYFEAHIEQGPVLERADIPIGVVTGSLGVRWYDVSVTGMEMHAGPTPMNERKDALYAASFLMQEVVRIANLQSPSGRGTVGDIKVFPGSRNVVPGKAQFTVDLRHSNAEILSSMDDRLRSACERTEHHHGVTIDVQQIQYFAPTPFATTMVDSVRVAAQLLGYPHKDMVTGAGHDAVYMAGVVPTAMIFVPCKDGVSHNEIEDAKPEHLEAGANVLLNVMLHTANAHSASGAETLP